MPRFKTVDDLVADIRSVIDESNETTVDNVTDILPSLNRAQVYAFDMLAKHYPEPLLFYTESSVAMGVRELDLPENIFEDRVEKVEFFNAGFYYECKRISYRDITYFETPAVVPVPHYYSIYGRKLRLSPAPDGSFGMRVWSMREPDELVLSQGRITATSTVNNYVVVEDLGIDLTTNSDNLNNYVNIIDGQTGTIKQTLQISSIAGNRITFRTSPTRTSVLNRGISVTLLDSVSIDDYVCIARGTCVPFFAFPIYNFLVQYTANEMNRKLKNDNTMGDDILFRKFEEQVKRSWTGRELTMRVKMRSKHWLPRRARKSRHT